MSSCSLTGVRDESSSILHNTYATLGVSISHSLWAGLRGAATPAGPFPFPTPKLYIIGLLLPIFRIKIICKLANKDWRRRMLAVVKIDGEKVRAAREGRFLSQRELAGKAGINHNTIWRIEGGSVEVHPRTIRKLAEALCVDPASLTPETDNG